MAERFVRFVMLVSFWKTCLSWSQRFELHDGGSQNARSSVLVTKTGDVFVAGKYTIYQFENGNISADTLVAEVNASLTGKENETTSVFKFFEVQNRDYLLRCDINNCFVHSSSNIAQFWQTVTYSNTVKNGHVHGFTLGGKISAQAVIKPAGGSVLCVFSALSTFGNRVSISERFLDVSNGHFYLDYADDLNRYIQTQSAHKFTFIFSFYDGHKYVYFLRNTYESGNNTTVYISQLCSQDTYFRSYIELKLQCGGYSRLESAEHINTSSGQILVAAFTSNILQGCALCSYRVDSLQQYFDERQEECFRGEKGSWPDWINPRVNACSVDWVIFHVF